MFLLTLGRFWRWSLTLGIIWLAVDSLQSLPLFSYVILSLLFLSLHGIFSYSFKDNYLYYPGSPERQRQYGMYIGVYYNKWLT
jgi:hypothetical protein